MFYLQFTMDKWLKPGIANKGKRGASFVDSNVNTYQSNQAFDQVSSSPEGETIEKKTEITSGASCSVRT